MLETRDRASGRPRFQNPRGWLVLLALAMWPALALAQSDIGEPGGGDIGTIDPCETQIDEHGEPIGIDPCCEMECDDGNPCTTEYCQDGVCYVEPVDCSDGDACTTDGCDQYGYCTHEPIECDDQDPCTTDSCDSSGGCVFEFACDDGDPCTDDFCDGEGNCTHVPIECDDGDPCTTEYCQDGVCYVEPVSCSDGDACTTDSCDQYGYCQHEPIECNDEDPCTTDTCDPATGCVFEFACDDGDDCTDDFCDSEGNCTHIPIDCDDGDPCTTEYCLDSVCYVDPIDCSDSDPCTDDYCDSAGDCQHDPIDCDDEDLCTIDYCDENGVCQHDPKCDDGTFCTDDVCDPETGECTYPPANDGECCEEDGDDCTEDICDNGECTHPEKDDPPPPDDPPGFKIQKKFDKHLKFPIIGKGLGIGTEFGAWANFGAGNGEVCSTSGEIGGMASIKAQFIGNGVSIDGEASGDWDCSMPTKCPEGCEGDKECDEDEECCTANGSGTLTVTRSFKKRIKLPIGSLYLNASIGGGLTGTVTKTWPSCAHNHTILGVGPIIKGSAGGGIEVCTGFIKWLCDCSQGRDPWTGQFTTSCANCQDCTPYAGGSLSGELVGQIQYHMPEGGVQFSWSGKGCINISGISIGPITFGGYKACKQI